MEHYVILVYEVHFAVYDITLFLNLLITSVIHIRV